MFANSAIGKKRTSRVAGGTADRGLNIRDGKKEERLEREAIGKQVGAKEGNSAYLLFDEEYLQHAGHDNIVANTYPYQI